MLIVLDDSSLGTTMHRVIDDAGFRPVVVATAAAARERIEGGLDPCVVLFALHSPDEGRRFIAQHSADARSSMIPVIFFTARPEARDAPSPIASALVAFVQRYCEQIHAGGEGPALH